MESTQYDRLVERVALARGLEMGGFYNAAKLLWAAAYSQELHASGERGIPTHVDDLTRQLDAAIAGLREEQAQPDLIAALEQGRDAVQGNKTIAASDIPDVHVCRSCGEIVLGGAPEACPKCGAWELTFRTFPAVYYLEPLPPNQALEALRTSPSLIRAMIGNLSDEQMALHPQEGEWNIHEVLAHLWISQELLAGRVTRMLAEDNPSLKAMAAWEVQNVEALPAENVLEKFRASREATVAALGAAAPNGWWRVGVHEEFGRVTVLQQASYFAKHDHNHLTQIRQILKAIGASGGADAQHGPPGQT